MNRLWIGVSTLALVALEPSLAAAQAATQDQVTTIDEVIVTAQRREQAAQDVGIAVSVADRNSGRIYGRRNAVDVTIGVIPQADGSLRVQFDAKNLGPQDQGLEDRFVQAYKRRMGH